MSDNAFLDTSVITYLLSEDDRKADVSQRLIATGGVISVQVINEFAAVASRKFGLTLPEIREVMAAVRCTCEVLPLTVDIHDLGMDVTERYGFYVCDSMIIAAALSCGVSVLFSEELEDGLVVDDCLRITNPYVAQ